MTKKLTWLVVCMVALIAFEGSIFARITGTTVDPETCWGDGGEEVCVDSSGNVIPTTDNDAALGTSSLRWSGVQAMDATFGDDVTVTDDLTVNGDSFLGDGPADEVGINESSPDATLEVAAGDNAYVLRISSQNGSTDLLSIASADGAIVQEGGAILNEGGASVDLRVEGDTLANLLIVDGSADSVGIGADATPDATLEVSGANPQYVLRVSSQNASTDLLAVDSVDVQVEFVGGSATKPGLAVSGDDDTGIYSIGANSFGITIAGVLEATIDANGIRPNNPATQTIGAGGTVAADACGGTKKISAAGAVTTDTTNTFTAPAAANTNCAMDVYNDGANAITLDNNANFMSAGAADVVLGSSDTIRVFSNGTVWAQIGGTGNN